MKKIIGLRAAFTPKETFVALPKKLPPPKKAVLPLGFPLGQLSPLVGEGDKVVAGQCIAEHPDALLPPVHASVSGVVSAIKHWPTHYARESLSIVLEGSEEQAGVEVSEQDITELEPPEILRLIRDAGIREPDSYAWPLQVRITQPQLTPPILFPFAPNLRKPIDSLIINAIDTEPGLYLRHEALTNYGQKLFETIPILKRLSLAKNVFLALPKGQPLSNGFGTTLKRLGCTLVSCPNKYPIALEPMLVRYVTGKEVPQPSYDSRAVGVAVVDILTTLKIYRALKDRSPAIETLLQVTMPGNDTSLNLRIREGTTLEELLNYLPSKPKKLTKTILGGPLLGNAQHDLRVPLTQEIQALILQDREGMSNYSNKPCVNCGYCVRSCPARLLPNQLSRLCEYGRFQEAEKNDLFSCIECGICAYVCPVRRPMVHLLRFGKQELIAQMEEA